MLVTPSDVPETIRMWIRLLYVLQLAYGNSESVFERTDYRYQVDESSKCRIDEIEVNTECKDLKVDKRLTAANAHGVHMESQDSEKSCGIVNKKTYNGLKHDCVTEDEPKEGIVLENDKFFTSKSAQISCSSVWCQSSPESGLRCHFENLYFNPDKKQFVFVMSPDSVVYGINSLKNLPDQLYLSSVEGHTAFRIPLSVIPNGPFLQKVPVRYIPEKSLFFGRFKPDNLLHVYHDDVIPLYFTVRELCSGSKSCWKDITVFVVDNIEEKDNWELYQMITDNIKLISELETESENGWYSFQDAYVGLNKASTWYQYGFGKSQGPMFKNKSSGSLLRQFSNFHKDKFGIKNSETDVLQGVLISRKSNRKILNEERLTLAIQNQLVIQSQGKEAFVKVLSLEEDDMHEIITELSRARVAVGVHGAALIFGMFLKPGSLLVEIWPYGIDPDVATVYKTMCELEGFGVAYMPWENKDFSNTIIHPEYPSHYGGIGHLTSHEQKDIVSSLHEFQLLHLECCNNPHWLFRIYQDTKICIDDSETVCESESFSKVLTNGLKMSEKLRLDKSSIQHFQRQIYPSRVEDVMCTLNKGDATSSTLSLSWKEPWNIALMNCHDLLFEVVIQAKGDKEASYNFVRSRRFVVKFDNIVDAVDVWVTAYCNNESGSGNDFYVKCK